MFFLIGINIFIPILVINIFTFSSESPIFSDFEISLYIKETDQIRKIPFEEYIAQVTYAEIPASFEKEAIKAQAIAVRSYTYAKLKKNSHENFDMCSDVNHCQAWREADSTAYYKKISEAVEETRGRVATYKYEIIDAVYHASSGGITEDAVNVWSNHEDYLVAVKSPKEEEIMKDFEVEQIVTKEEFLNKLNLLKLEEMKIVSKTEGERVKEILINDKTFTGNEIRKIFNLRSSNFEVFEKNGNIIFKVKGYGHGVGLSQWGAQAMALDGKTCDEIIKHYYTGVEIVNSE